jgi:hypothetical protein
MKAAKLKSSLKLICAGGIIIILGILSLTSCSKADMSFFNKVLHDYDSTSYFITVDLKSDSYKGRALIENRNLYHFFNETQGFDTAKYVAYMRKTLTKHKKISLKGRDIIKFNFLKVEDNMNVLLQAGKGRNSFVAAYFDGSVLNFGIPLSEQYAVINQLFYWEYAVKRDQLTGNLLIGE